MSILYILLSEAADGVTSTRAVVMGAADGMIFTGVAVAAVAVDKQGKQPRS